MSTPLVRLYRGQVGKHDGVDVSRKSSGLLGRPFAPPWELVLGSKSGQIDWATYTQCYGALLQAIPGFAITNLWETGVVQGGELGLLCYCRLDKAECHTVLLIEFLTSRYPRSFAIKLGRHT